MKKQIITINIDNYCPEITKLTFPNMERFAQKTGADFNIITTRAFNIATNYEKFQLRKLSKGYDWTLYLDADCLINPDIPDFTEFTPKDTTLIHGFDYAPTRFKSTQYNHRSNCYKGIPSWCVWFSDWVAEDLWTPMKSLNDWSKLCKNITPTTPETNSATPEPDHYMDDYLLSQNIARYNLKTKSIQKIASKKKIDLRCFYHLYAVNPANKLEPIQQVANAWNTAHYIVTDQASLTVISKPLPTKNFTT